MKITCLPASAIIVAIFTLSAFSQSHIVINTPGEEPAKAELSTTEKRLLDRSVLPKARKRLAGDACEESVEVSGIVHGAFTKAGADQTFVFYQFCQTGNGLGSVGAAVFEGNRVVANLISEESGWSVDAKVLPDINGNGLNEVALYYSGGMHQGSGGTGVDIMEFSGTALKGIGWFQADSFTEKTSYAFKVSVKPGPVPQFFSEKWSSYKGKYRRVGGSVPLKLKPVFGKFEAIK
jgi:hypothetical protein